MDYRSVVTEKPPGLSRLQRAFGHKGVSQLLELSAGVTGLVRMLPLFGVVWATKRIVADREREARVEYGV
ncbi:hypothetical protein PG993_008113 [Apiospora rasikravindrae]|uniref:Uncharacterized protein n=1 Tax=Apiospora rasikravindrae TaxID=990691 RepID=A0ABR1SZE4_9PEZI